LGIVFKKIRPPVGDGGLFLEVFLWGGGGGGGIYGPTIVQRKGKGE